MAKGRTTLRGTEQIATEPQSHRHPDLFASARKNELDAGGLQGRPSVRHANGRMKDARVSECVIHPTIRMPAPPLCGAASSAFHVSVDSVADSLGAAWHNGLCPYRRTPFIPLRFCALSFFQADGDPAFCRDSSSPIRAFA